MTSIKTPAQTRQLPQVSIPGLPPPRTKVQIPHSNRLHRTERPDAD